MTTTLIDEVIDSLKEKYDINRTELERIIHSQFHVARKNMEEKNLKTINLIHIGKFKPSPWFIKNRPIFLEKLNKMLDEETD